VENRAAGASTTSPRRARTASYGPARWRPCSPSLLERSPEVGLPGTN
jgi:hypothetical protein